MSGGEDYELPVLLAHDVKEPLRGFNSVFGSPGDAHG